MTETSQRYRTDGNHCGESPQRKCSTNRRVPIMKTKSLWLLRRTMYERE